MNRLLLVVVAAAAAAASAPQEDEGQFFAAMLDRFPQARPGEFPTPESVVREYFQAIIDNQVVRTFKCLPLKERYRASAFETQVARLGVYDPTSIPSPEDHYSRFMKVLTGHHRTVYFLRCMLLAKSDPEMAELFKKRTDAEMKGGKIDPEWIQRMADRLSLRKLRKWRIKEISYDPPQKAKELHGIPVSETTMVRITLVHGESELPLEDIVVAKIEGKYQIMYFLGLPSGFR